MEEQKITRTIKKKFLWIDKVGKSVKGAGGYAASFGVGFLAKKVAQNVLNSEEDMDDDEETEN